MKYFIIKHALPIGFSGIYFSNIKDNDKSFKKNNFIFSTDREDAFLFKDFESAEKYCKILSDVLPMKWDVLRFEKDEKQNE